MIVQVWDPNTQVAPLISPPSSYHELVDRYVRLYTHNVDLGRIEPFVWPWRFLHVYLFLLYFIVIPPSWLDAQQAKGSSLREWRRWACVNGKYPVYLAFVWRSLDTIYYCRSPASAVSYAIGLTTMFAIWAFAALFVFRDARFDALRLEREKIPSIAMPKMNGNGHRASNGTAHNGAAPNGSVSNGTVSNGTILNGNVSNGSPSVATSNGVVSRKKSRQTSAAAVPCKTDTELKKSEDGYRYYWQPLPPTVLHRAVWILDLISSFRGAGWKHQVRTMAAPPAHIIAQLPADQRPTAKPTCRSYTTTAELLRANLVSITVAYILWDMLKAVMLTDPYFIGIIDSPSPAWLPQTVAQSPTAVRLLRTAMSGTGVILLLRAWFALSPLFFVGVLGPLFRALPYYGLDIKAEPWLYPDVFGDPAFIASHGIAGLWGAWWQQIFRNTFSAPAEALAASMGWKARSGQAKVSGMVVAFVISGTLHLAASWTQVGRTRPIMAFLYFPLQGVGIAVETAISMVLTRVGVAAWFGEDTKRIIRTVWTVFAVFVSAPFFADDMARGGIWLFEPVPISYVRGLGMGGVASDGWWCWHGAHIWWHSAQRWWESGIAV
jgi:hypothetical protein